MFNSLKQFFLVLFAVSHVSCSTDYTSDAEAAMKALQVWYDEDTGLYNTTGWWNSANALTTLGNLATLDMNVKSEVTSLLANSWVEAQKYNLQQTKIITSDYNMETIMGSGPVINPKGFLNGFYDDEGWWALNWINAYDLTGNETYLDTAADIFENMKNGSEPICKGGIWWDKTHTYVNAIANELYLSVASHLANRMPQNKKYYLDIANTQWTWFQNSGMINAQHTINDGLTNTTCENNNGTVWSYNQGVILGALVELQKAGGNNNLLTVANTIANAAINALSTDGVLHDVCEPDCGGDGDQFKGIFMRNLQILQTASPSSTYLSFIASNANAIWKKDRDDKDDDLSVVWSGPYVSPANASTQSSALDGLVAAVAFEAQVGNGISSRDNSVRSVARR